jgi:GAF domain-containing protein
VSDDLISGATERKLLQSIVEVARQVYGAAASSVFIVSPDTGELIFAAVSGEGEQSLVGKRFPVGTGIAGWVVASCQPIITDEVGELDQFAHDAASSTGYVPNSIMAAPLVSDGECIGVLEVLDRYARGSGASGRELGDMDLLGLLATQAALGLTLLREREEGSRPIGSVGSLLSRLADHAAKESYDPLALTLLAASVELLDRRQSVV